MNPQNWLPACLLLIVHPGAKCSPCKRCTGILCTTWCNCEAHMSIVGNVGSGQPHSKKREIILHIMAYLQFHGWIKCNVLYNLTSPLVFSPVEERRGSGQDLFMQVCFTVVRELLSKFTSPYSTYWINISDIYFFASSKKDASKYFAPAAEIRYSVF